MTNTNITLSAVEKMQRQSTLNKDELIAENGERKNGDGKVVGIIRSPFLQKILADEVTSLVDDGTSLEAACITKEVTVSQYTDWKARTKEGSVGWNYYLEHGAFPPVKKKGEIALTPYEAFLKKREERDALTEELRTMYTDDVKATFDRLDAEQEARKKAREEFAVAA